MECYSLSAYLKKFMTRKCNTSKNIYNIQTGKVLENVQDKEEIDKTYVRYDTYRPSIFKNSKSNKFGTGNVRPFKKLLGDEKYSKKCIFEGKKINLKIKKHNLSTSGNSFVDQCKTPLIVSPVSAHKNPSVHDLSLESETSIENELEVKLVIEDTSCGITADSTLKETCDGDPDSASGTFDSQSAECHRNITDDEFCSEEHQHLYQSKNDHQFTDDFIQKRKKNLNKKHTFERDSKISNRKLKFSPEIHSRPSEGDSMSLISENCVINAFSFDSSKEKRKIWSSGKIRRKSSLKPKPCSSSISNSITTSCPDISNPQLPEKVLKSHACIFNSDELEDQLVRVLEKNTELTIQNTDLQKQVQQLQNVKGDTGISHSQNENLESILKHMRDASDKRREYESERTEALHALKDLQKKSTSALEKAKNFEVIEALQSKIRELEKKTELQNVRHEELLLELAAFKRSEQNKSSSDSTGPEGSCWKRSALHQEIQTSPDSNTSIPELNSVSKSAVAHDYSENHWSSKQRSYLSSSTGNPLERERAVGTASANISVVDALSALNPNIQFPLNPGLLIWSPADVITGMAFGSFMDNSSAPVSSSGGSSSGSGGNTSSLHYHPTSNSTNITSAIDHIMAKIDQDNRILAELDKTRSTIGIASGKMSSLSSNFVQPRLLPSVPTAQSSRCGILPTSTGTIQSLALGDSAQQLGTHNTGVGLPLMSAQTIPISALTQPGLINPLLSTANPTAAAAYQLMLNSAANLTQPNNPMLPTLVTPHRVMPQIPAIITSQYDLDRTYADPSLSDSKQPDMLDIPGKGRCFVYIARYTYDPFSQSPNECPEAELPICAGDYLLVWGNMDEDGFFDGELLDGRRGLVPSNFVEKLAGDDLLEFHQSVVVGLRESDESGSTTIPQDLEYIHSDEYGKRSGADYNLGGTLEEDDEDDLQSGEGPVPAPKQLTLERQLNKSILIGWNPPENCHPSAIESYHVYVDGVLKTTVKATERTRALVEGVDSNRPHRISVRSVTLNRRTSRDAACTMVIGKDVPFGPTCVRASHVTSTSAVISWLPSNSNHQHTVCVNSVEVRTVKPGVYRHTITGLAPNTLYRVTVRAKNIRAPHFDEKTNIPVEKFSCHVDFRTLPKGLPEPPVDIQVESGPQDGTLLVTWLPVTANNSTNTALVTGYAVYADGKKVTDVDSPTGDHALIDINKLVGLNPKQVTVRTKSRDNQSSDSIPTPIPSSILKGEKHTSKQDDRRRYGSAMPPHMRHHQPQRNAHGQVIIDPEENLSDKEIYPGSHMIPAIEITKDTASEGNFSEDDYLDRSHRGQQKGHHPPSQSGYQQYYEGSHHPHHYHQRPLRSHGERGRPSQPSMSHERPRPPRPRDDRDQFYMERGGREDVRRRESISGGYRGRGGSWPPQNQNIPQAQPKDRRIRHFVALFDYDPQTMSPNPDACEEELAFSEGDAIKIIGEKDNDGFYWGELRGRRGFVPHNMVAEIQDASKNSDARNRDRWGDIYANMPVKKMVAMYDYDPQELSPNVDGEQVELSFQTGNIIYVYGDMDDDGFYMGELDGVRGLVPSNFLTEAPADYNNGSGPTRGPRPHQKSGPPDRGHGPGVRGPPPPPREGIPRMDPRDRRKDPSALQFDHTKDRMEGMKGQRGEALDRRGSRMDARGGGGGAQYPPELHSGVPGRGPPEYPSDEGVGAKPAPPPSNPMKGTPKVVPDFVIPNNKESPTSAQPTNKFPGIPETPNLMQKLSEITGNVTGGRDSSVDNILSKGKELIFMKFGLGK